MADNDPVLPVLKVVGGLLGLLGWLLFLGLQRVWRVTFGWIFTTLANLLDAVRIPIPLHADIHPFGSVADWLRSLNRNVAHALAAAADASEHLAVWLFSRVRLAFAWIGREIEHLAADVLSMGLRIVRVYVPRLVRSLLRLVWRELHKLIHFAHSQIRHLQRLLLAAKNALWKAVKWELRQLRAFGRSLLHTFGGIYRNLRAIYRRLRKAERWLFGKGFTGLVHEALKRLDAVWLFATNVKRLGKFAMRLDVGAVYEFVKDAVIIVGETDLCKLAAYQMDVAVYVIEPVVQRLIGITEWVCRHEGHTLPSACEDSPGYLLAWAPSATPPITQPFTPKRLAPHVPLPRGVIEA